MVICTETPTDQASQKVTDETEEGFASIAKQKLDEDYVPPTDAAIAEVGDELDDETVPTKV